MHASAARHLAKQSTDGNSKAVELQYRSVANMIENASKRHKYSVRWTMMPYIFGVPSFDVPVVFAKIVHLLQKQGYKVTRPRDANSALEIRISWK